MFVIMNIDDIYIKKTPSLVRRIVIRTIFTYFYEVPKNWVNSFTVEKGNPVAKLCIAHTYTRLLVHFLMETLQP